VFLSSSFEAIPGVHVEEVVVVGNTETKLTVADTGRDENGQKTLSPKAVDELREILRKDEDIREFFLLLKNRELRMQAVDAINAHLARKANA
jgi:putative heme degradation protein